MRRDLDTESGTIDSDSLCSPPEIAEPMLELYGGPCDVDPATNEHSIIAARVKYTELGLIRPWCRPRHPGARNYVNWPYSTNEPWADKAIYEMKTGNVAELVVLCMSATSTLWWRSMMTLPRRNPRVICTRRLAFLGPDGVPMESGARFDTTLIYYGPRERTFDRLFRHVARWSTRGR